MKIAPHIEINGEDEFKAELAQDLDQEEAALQNSPAYHIEEIKRIAAILQEQVKDLQKLIDDL